MNMLTAQTRQVLRKTHANTHKVHSHTHHPRSQQARRKTQQRNTNQKPSKLYSYAKHTNTISTNRAHADTTGFSDDTLRTKNCLTPNLRSDNKSPLRRNSKKTTNCLNNRSQSSTPTSTSQNHTVPTHTNFHTTSQKAKNRLHWKQTKARSHYDGNLMDIEFKYRTVI